MQARRMYFRHQIRRKQLQQQKTRLRNEFVQLLSLSEEGQVNWRQSLIQQWHSNRSNNAKIGQEMISEAERKELLHFAGANIYKLKMELHNDPPRNNRKMQIYQNILCYMNYQLLNSQTRAWQANGQLYGQLYTDMKGHLQSILSDESLNNVEQYSAFVVVWQQLLNYLLLCVEILKIDQLKQQLFMDNMEYPSECQWMVYGLSKYRQNMLQLLEYIRDVYFSDEDIDKKRVFIYHGNMVQTYMRLANRMLALGIYQSGSNRIKMQTTIIGLFDGRVMELLVVFMKCQIYVGVVQTIADIMGKAVINYDLFKIVIDCQLLDYIKLYLVISDCFKTFTRHTKRTQEVITGINLFLSVKQILFNISQTQNTDILWEIGLAQDVKMIIGEVESTKFKEELIELMFMIVMHIGEAQTLDRIYKAEVFQWTLNILNTKVQLGFNQTDNIIETAISVIQFFFNCGQIQKKDKSLQCNPYILKFKYMRGVQILQNFQPGQKLMDSFDCQSSYLL